MRPNAERLLMHAGDYLGLSADEFFALVLLSAFAGAVFAAMFVVLAGFSPVLIPILGAGAGYLAYSEVRHTIELRRRDVNRALPSAIDLIALCMSAGLDFAGALTQITKNAPLGEDPLVEELGLILHHLQLGHPRTRALEVFAMRIPSEAVTDFVSAVIQAERKGNPLRETLTVQATVLRQRRSVRAEELAAKAASKMIIPMTLLVLSALLLVVGPMALNAMKTGFFK